MTVEVNSSLENSTEESRTYWRRIAIPTWREFILFILHKDSSQHVKIDLISSLGQIINC